MWFIEIGLLGIWVVNIGIFVVFDGYGCVCVMMFVF